MKKLFIYLSILFSTMVIAQQKNNADKTIDRIMDENAELLFKASKTYSISIGVIKGGKVYTKHYGEIDKNKDNKANNDTYFEIASVTKIMTGYLMAKAVLEKKINLEDDIRKYIKGDYPNLQYNGTPIRIKNLISYETAIPSVLPDDREIFAKGGDSITFRLHKLYGAYSREKLLKDLQKIKLDTIPGTRYNYSNPSLELSGYILENIYGKPFEILLKENIWQKLGMNQTKFTLSKTEKLANGYNENHLLMPHYPLNDLWGSAGMKTKSTMNDLLKLLQFELQKDNKIVQESQRNVEDRKTHYFGYFWDLIEVGRNGKHAFKHGGAFGNQVLLTVYPEQDMGICVIVNIDGPNSPGILHGWANEFAEQLISPNAEKENYGYRVEKDKVIFSYKHAQNLDPKLINSISIAGDFNSWNAENKSYQLVLKNKNTFELSLPKSQFEKGKAYAFKFVINNTSWLGAPYFATNADGTSDKNLILKIE